MKNLSKTNNSKLVRDLIERGFDSSESNIIILSSPGSALKVYKHLKILFPENNFIHLPNSELLPYDFFSSPSNIRSERINALYKLTLKSKKTLICSIQTLMGPCANYLHVCHINNLKIGDVLNRNQLISQFEKNGYKTIIEPIKKIECAIIFSLFL